MAGRGSTHNIEHRFSGPQIEAVDDSWQAVEWEAAFRASRPRTEVREIQAKTIISHNLSPDVPFGRSINPYQGCEHGCIYCYARPSHAYLELSPGLDFETRLFAKLNAAALLRREFAKPSYQPQTIVLGANTDPYQPIEHHYRLTRELLEVMLAHRHPVGIITKSAMILRDLDLLAELAREGLCQVMVSVTTLNETLRRQLEPRASTGAGRLKVIEKLAQAGIPVGVLAAPMIPRLNEPELEQIIKGAVEAGAAPRPVRATTRSPRIRGCPVQAGPSLMRPVRATTRSPRIRGCPVQAVDRAARVLRVVPVLAVPTGPVRVVRGPART